MFRRVANPTKPIGLAYGFLMGPQVDDAVRKALPGWAIVLDATAPGANGSQPVNLAMLAAGRALVGAPAGTPIGLMGWSNGCLNGVRSTLLGNLLGPDLRFIHVADGTHASVPPTTGQIKVWADQIERARKGDIVFTATCSSMTYTKNIKLGQPGRAWPTSWVLGQALGYGDDYLQVGQPIVEGGLYVEKFPSPEDASPAAGQAHRDQVNIHLPATLAKYWKLPGTAIEAPEFPPETPYVAVLMAAKMWLNLAPVEDKGKNRGDAIDAWLSAVGVAVGNSYCAAFASQCIRDAWNNGLHRPAPVKGSAGARALMGQFKDAGLLVPCRTPNGTALPRESWIHGCRPGALAFWARPPDPAHGHTAIVVDRGQEDFWVIGGNEDRVLQPVTNRIMAVDNSGHHLNDPLLLGFGVWDPNDVHPG